jgi:hypothetical protein
MLFNNAITNKYKTNLDNRKCPYTKAKLKVKSDDFIWKN